MITTSKSTHKGVHKRMAWHQRTAARPQQHGIKVKARPPPQHRCILLSRCLQENRASTLKEGVLLPMAVHVQRRHRRQAIIPNAHDAREQRHEKHPHPAPTHRCMVRAAVEHCHVTWAHAARTALTTQQLPACQTQRRLPRDLPAACTARLVHVQVQVLRSDTCEYCMHSPPAYLTQLWQRQQPGRRRVGHACP